MAVDLEDPAPVHRDAIRVQHDNMCGKNDLLMGFFVNRGRRERKAGGRRKRRSKRKRKMWAKGWYLGEKGEFMGSGRKRAPSV